jgi:putative membrane protein
MFSNHPNKREVGMRLLLVSVAAAALLSGCARNEPPAEPVVAVDPSSPLAAPNYLSMAGSSDQFEIQSGQLAQQMSQNAGIRQIGQMLVADHTNSTQQLMAAAQSAGITPPPPALRPEHAALLQQIQSAPPGQFDMVFRDVQIQAHQQALQLHQGYASGGDTPALRTAATNIVPVVQNHLTMLQSLALAPPPPPPPAPAYQDPARPGERG